MAPNHMHNPSQDQEAFKNWIVVCQFCQQPSKYRALVFDPRNCSCSESGSPINESRRRRSGRANGYSSAQHRSPYRGIPYNQAGSVSSDGGSVKGQEGLEHLDTNNKILEVVPPAGLGEYRHQLSAIVDQIEVEVDYALQRYLSTLTPLERSYHCMGHGSDDEEIDLPHNNGRRGFLRQDPHIIGPTDHSQRAADGSSNDSRNGLPNSRGPNGLELVRRTGSWIGMMVVENPGTLVIDDWYIDLDDEDLPVDEFCHGSG